MREITIQINAEDYDTMLEKVMDLVVQGLKATRIDHDRIMIKYQGYTIIDRK
jgi:hypothetical protein